MEFTKCELCDSEVSTDKCLFATCTRIIEGKEYHFCCISHADEFQKKKSDK